MARLLRPKIVLFRVTECKTTYYKMPDNVPQKSGLQGVNTGQKRGLRGANISIRLGDLRESVEAVAASGHVSVAEVIRMCVVGGLPTVARCFSAMQIEFADMTARQQRAGAKAKAKKARATTSPE